MESMVAGMSKACKENGISLIGGETAEMPGTYTKVNMISLVVLLVL